MQWHEGLNVGIEELDIDHKKLLEITNDLVAAISGGKAPNEVDAIFDELIEASKKHFEKEEAIFEEYGSSSLDEHIKLHQDCLDEIYKQKKKFSFSKTEEQLNEIGFLLIDWLLDHILEEDLKAINELKKRKNFQKKEKGVVEKVSESFGFTKRIFILAIVPLVAMLIFGFSVLWSNYLRYDDVKKTSGITHIISNINRLAHHLQIERGLSGGYISSSHNKFLKSLNKQRVIVDSEIKNFYDKLKKVDKNKIEFVKGFIDKFEKDALFLSDFRKKIDKNEVDQTKSINYYTNIIENLLSITSNVAMLNFDREISTSISSLSSLLHVKETLGLKRAYGTMLIEKKGDNKLFIDYIRLIGVEETLLSNFHTMSPKQFSHQVNAIVSSPLNQHIIKLEEEIKEQVYLHVDSLEWFEKMTRHIDNLKVVEDNLLTYIDELIIKSLDENVNNLYLWIVYTLSIFFVTLAIIYIFEESSKNEINKLIKALKHLADGGRSLRFDSKKRSTQMSKVYDAYEQTRQKLLKGDIYTELYLNKKEEEIKKHLKENDKLEEMAFHDPLTKAYNRRKFETLSNLELKRSRRYERDLSFLLFDLDHFKKINDTYGHATGDEVLKDFVLKCQDSVRDIDVVARVGGEEFVIMLPETNSENAYVFAERIRQKVEEARVKIGNATINYTVSVGITSFTDEEKIEQLSQKADIALYEAKNSGRNTVKIK